MGVADRRGSLSERLAAWGRQTTAGLALVALALGAYLALDELEYDPRVDRALEGSTAVRQVHEAMIDQQTGLRGLLLSGDERFLEAYERGRDALPAANAAATDVIAGRDRVGHLLVELRVSQQRWIDRWAERALELGVDGDAVPGDFLDLDKQLFDDYRERHEVLAAELRRQRADAVGDQRVAGRLAIGVVLALTVGLGVLSAARSRSLRRSVEPPLAELLARLDAIGEGRLDVGGPIDGPSELQQLAGGVDDCAR